MQTSQFVLVYGLGSIRYTICINMTTDINMFYCHFRSYYLLFLVLIPHAEITELRYGTALEGFEFDARWPLGLRMCGRSCGHRGRCWSVNYYRSTLHCQYNEAGDPGESAELIANSDATHIAITSQVCSDFF